MKVPFIEFEYELEIFKKDFKDLINTHAEVGEFIGGNSVVNFEENLKNYLSVKNVVSVGNGTDALLISLLTLELERKEVIVPSFSFFATSEAIVQANLNPVFIDIDQDNCNIDVKQIEKNINENTGAILPVHLFGNSANMEKVMELAEKYDLKVVEDVAQSFGSEYQGKKLGTIGEIGCFSFFPTKTLGAYGDGGAIVTNNDNYAEKARALKNHGSKTKYVNEFFGYNSRLDSIQASILNLKLREIDNWISYRQKIGNYYDIELKKIPAIQVLNNKNSTFNYYSFIVHDDKRDELKEYLELNNISTAIYYPKTLPSLPAHDINLEFPVAEKMCREILSIPIWPGISKNQAQYVIKTINNFFN